MGLLIGRPAINKQAGGDRNAARDAEQRGNADLRPVLIALGLVLLNQVVGKLAKDGDSYKHSYANWQVRKSTGAGTESILTLVNNRECRHEEIHDAVLDRDIQCHECDDWDKYEKLHWSYDGLLEALLEGDIAVRANS